MSEINTKIFKPQKWVLDVLNSPKGETIEFEIEGNTYSFFKISDKVPEDMGKAIYFYSYAEGVSFSADILTEISPSVYNIGNAFLIFTNDVEDISKGAYFSEEFYEILKEEGVTELYIILQTTQDFSISKKTIEGEVHPIEEKYIPDGGTVIYVIDCEYLAARSSGFAILPYTEVDFQNLMVNLIDNGCCILALRVNNTTISQKEVFTSIKISPFYRNCVFTRIVDNYELFPLMEWSDSGEYSSYNGYLYLDMISYD